MPIGALTLYLLLPGCQSLKEKRGRLKPLLARLHREFNVSVAEMDRQDSWQESIIACVMVGSDRVALQRALQTIVVWVESNWPDLSLADDRIEIIT